MLFGFLIYLQNNFDVNMIRYACVAKLVNNITAAVCATPEVSVIEARMRARRHAYLCQIEHGLMNTKIPNISPGSISFSTRNWNLYHRICLQVKWTKSAFAVIIDWPTFCFSFLFIWGMLHVKFRKRNQMCWCWTRTRDISLSKTF